RGPVGAGRFMVPDIHVHGPQRTEVSLLGLHGRSWASKVELQPKVRPVGRKEPHLRPRAGAGGRGVLRHIGRFAVAGLAGATAYLVLRVVLQVAIGFSEGASASAAGTGLGLTWAQVMEMTRPEREV